MKWIGLTGGIGSGKSTFANAMKSMGIPVINADQLAHQALQPGTKTYSQVVSQFGSDILANDNTIDRKRLGQMVFKDKRKLRELESILHPSVRELAELQKERHAQSGQLMAVYDVPLLYEKNMQSLFDLVIVVSCSEEEQVRRVMQRNHLSEAEVRERMSHQIPLAEKAQLADVVIENSGSEEALKNQAKQFIEKYS